MHEREDRDDSIESVESCPLASSMSEDPGLGQYPESDPYCEGCTLQIFESRLLGRIDLFLGICSASVGILGSNLPFSICFQQFDVGLSSLEA